MSLFTPATRGLVEMMAATPRGPRRDGLFALWLTVRLIEDLPQPGPGDRAFRRRVALLQKRLSSLMLQPPVRRGINAIVSALESPAQQDIGALFHKLAAAVRDGVPTEATELLVRAGRASR
jgi:hypothetical protein